MASVRSSKNSTGSVGATAAVDFGPVHTGRCEKVDVFSTLTSTVSLLSHAQGYGQTAANNTVVNMEIYFSAIDPTDSDNKLTPTQTNAAPGGGLVPTQLQLNTFFSKQLTSDPVSVTFTTAATNLVAECFVTLPATETFMVVQAFSDGGLTCMGRVETYLFESVLPVSHTGKTSALPSGAASAALQTAGNSLLTSVNNQAATIAAKTIDTSAIGGTVAVSSVAGTVVVNGSGVTQPVSGTVTVANTASNKLYVQTATDNALKVTNNLDGNQNVAPFIVARQASILPQISLSTVALQSLTPVSDAIDTQGFTNVRLFGRWDYGANAPTTLYSAWSNSGTADSDMTVSSNDSLYVSEVTVGADTYYSFDRYIAFPPRYLRFYNHSGNAITNLEMNVRLFT